MKMIFKSTLLVLMCVLSYVSSQDDSSRMELYKKLVANLCGPDLAADKAKIIKECENSFPKPAQDTFISCAKQAFGITEVTDPSFCYYPRPGSEKLIECLKAKEAEYAARGIVIDAKQKEKFEDIYLGCMAKAL